MLNPFSGARFSGARFSGGGLSGRTVYANPMDPVFQSSEDQLNASVVRDLWSSSSRSSPSGTWQVKSGDLRGLVLNGETGRLTGWPTESTRLMFEKVDGTGKVVDTGGMNVVLRTKLGDSALSTPQTLVASASGTNYFMVGGTGNDRLTSGDGQDFLHGGEGDDTLTSGGGTDRIYGDGGNDMIIAAPAGGTYDGGDDVDTISFAVALRGVTANLGNANGRGTIFVTLYDAAGNVFPARVSNFENMIGSAHADHLTGDGGANVLDGGAGADTLDGGAGRNTLTGGADWASYEHSPSGVTVNLGGERDGDGYVTGTLGAADFVDMDGNAIDGFTVHILPEIS